MFDQIKDNKPVLAGIGLAILLVLFLIVDSFVSQRQKLAVKVTALENQVAEVSSLAAEIKSLGGGINTPHSAGQISALLPWLEKRFNVTKMTDKVDNMALKANNDAKYSEVVNFRLANIGMADLLPLLQQFDQLSELKLIKADLSRAKSQGMTFDAELGLIK